MLISALLSPTGAPARTVMAWREGRFELIVSAKLLNEFQRALTYPKLQRRIPADKASAILTWIASEATTADDVADPPTRSRDPDDDYLLAVAESRRAALVTGDADLLTLGDRFPIFSARDFLDWLDDSAA